MFGVTSPYLIKIFGGASVILTLACGLLFWLYTDGLEKNAALSAQNSGFKAQIEELKQNQQTAYEVSDAYQKKLSDLNKRHDDLKRMYGHTCIPVRDDPASGGHHAAPADQLSGSDGLSTTALLDFARDADQVREQLIGCQNFIAKISRKGH